MTKELQISKLDAARRQLELAIRLYFHNDDPVSLHTLTAAGYAIVRDVNRARDGSPMLVKDQMLEMIKPEYVSMFRKKMNEAENFFKHADRDHDGVLTFNPDQTEMLLLDACARYFTLSGEFPPLFRMFQMWFMCNQQHLFSGLPDEQQRLLKRASVDVSRMGREEFLSTVLPLVNRL